MKDTDIRKYAELMKELGLTGLEIEDDSTRVRLERLREPEKPLATRETAAQPTPAQEPLPTKDYVSVRSPLVGVFYSSPAENAAPYVSVGDSVTEGQVLCIVEAMKLMNEITAEYSGTIAQIMATNGQVVEYGTELFRIKR